MKLITRIIAFLLPAATVESAVKALCKAVDRLEAAERNQNEKRVGLEHMIEDLQAQAAAATKEAADARRIRSNLTKLIID